MKEGKLLELAELYESERGGLDTLTTRVGQLQRQLDAAREWDEKWLWCRQCGKRHTRWSDVGRKHRAVRIPKRCLTKYDHIFNSVGFRQGSIDEEAYRKAIERLAEKHGIEIRFLLECATMKRDLSPEGGLALLGCMKLYECMICGKKAERFYHVSPWADRIRVEAEG